MRCRTLASLEKTPAPNLRPTPTKTASPNPRTNPICRNRKRNIYLSYDQQNDNPFLYKTRQNISNLVVFFKYL